MYLALTFVIIIWGGSFIVINQLVTFATPLTVGTWRAIFSSGMFLVIQSAVKRRERRFDNDYPRKIQPQDRKRYSLVILTAGLSGIGLYFPVQYTAIELAGPSISALMVCLGSPVLMVGISAILFKEKVTWIKGIGFVVASIGAFLIITGGNLSTLSPRSGLFIGNVFVILSPCLWSIYSISSKKAQDYELPLKSTALITYVGTMVLLLFSLLTQDITNWWTALQHPEFYLGLLYVSLGCSVYGYFAWSVAMAKLPAGNVGSFLYVEPFITVFFAWIFLQQIISPYAFLGGGIVLIALLFIARGAKNVNKMDSKNVESIK
ncbi:MAG TPA: DMT family transporter [Candidatus Lokiarchaeia archaeon]|nr:DMT family transporter [Candidatus Lokiarchaeia archaeon]